MNTIIFVPGGGGSRLSLNGQEIWPPSFLEFVTQYSRIAELQDPGVDATGIFDVYPPGSLVYCYDVYRTLLDDLNTIANYIASNRLDFYYDWRIDIADSADQLAKAIANCINGGSTSITLVCHSMGNLLARWLLESGIYSSESWFDSVTHYVGLCGPHLGTPENLEYVLGDKGFLCISPEDTKTVSANPHYPGAGYQCLPFQNYPAPVLDDINLGVQNLYDKTVAANYGLTWSSIQAARNLQNKLGFGRKPPLAKYSLVAASGLTTDETVVYDSLNYTGTYSDQLGDGTIPLLSADVLQLNTQVTPGDHIGVLKTYPFRQILYQILTGFSAARLLPPLTLENRPGVAVCVNKFVFSPHEPIELLIVSDLVTDNIVGTFQILGTRGADAAPFVYREQVFEYKGPPIQLIRATVAAPSDSGGYQIVITGSHGTSPRTAASFAVSKWHQRRTRAERRRRRRTRTEKRR